MGLKIVMRILVAFALVAGLSFCQGCESWKSNHYESTAATAIPVTAPKSIGGDGQAAVQLPRSVYLSLNIRSEPSGATLKVNDILVGTTPLIASIPFPQDTYGRPMGSAELCLQKPGYQPRMVEVYASGGRSVSLEPEGEPLVKYVAHLDAPGAK